MTFTSSSFCLHYFIRPKQKFGKRSISADSQSIWQILIPSWLFLLECDHYHVFCLLLTLFVNVIDKGQRCSGIGAFMSIITARTYSFGPG